MIAPLLPALCGPTPLLASLMPTSAPYRVFRCVDQAGKLDQVPPDHGLLVMETGGLARYRFSYLPRLMRARRRFTKDAREWLHLGRKMQPKMFMQAPT